MKNCSDIDSLLIRQFTGDLLPDERDYLESHLVECASCADEEQGLNRMWRRFDSLPEPQIPANLHKRTRERINGYLKWERVLRPLVSKISNCGAWAFSILLLGGFIMTGTSYLLVRNVIGTAVHHHYILFSLYGLWWLLFAACLGLLLRMNDHIVPQLSLVSAQSILVVFLTLIITFLAFEIELLRQPRMYAASKLAAASEYLLGIGNIFIANWWIHCCLASFIGALTFAIGRFPFAPGNVLVGSLIATVLLIPAIFLQGASYNHGYGIIAFAALGTFAAALVGMASGLLIGRQLLFQPAWCGRRAYFSAGVF